MTSTAKTAWPKLNIELGTVMLAAFSGETNPVKGLFVGLEPGSFVILRLPGGQGVEDHLFEDNPVVIRYIADGTVYGFQSRVLSYVYRKKLILAVLAYPSSVETHVLREAQRVDFLVPAVLSAAGREIRGIVVDISTGGCRFRFETAEHPDAPDFNVEKKARIAFQLVGIEGQREIDCEVMNTARPGGSLFLGLKFDRTDEAVTRGLEEYVAEVSRYFAG